MMQKILVILNEAPYGSERSYNGLRLAGALAANESVEIKMFLLADSVGCAKVGQKVPEGFYNIQLMLGKVIRKGQVALCGTCMDARGIKEEELMDGAAKSTLAQLAEWTIEADKVITF